MQMGNGNITFGDGTTQSTAATASSYAGFGGQVFTAPGTFTIPTGVTKLKVTVIGGGGGQNGFSTALPSPAGASQAGGGGGGAIGYLTGLTPGGTLAVTVGAGGAGGASNAGLAGSGGTSSVSSGTQTITAVTATGASSALQTGNGNSGVGSGGSINLYGGSYTSVGFGSSCSPFNPPSTNRALLTPSAPTYVTYNYGNGGSGGGSFPYGGPGGAGSGGIVVFEW